jgi:hypothetical protein
MHETHQSPDGLGPSNGPASGALPKPDPEVHLMKIRVIGVYLPRLDPAGIAAFIERNVKGYVKTMTDLRSKGMTRTTDEEIQERAGELPEELNRDLQHCALFELEVLGNESDFDPSDFENGETGYAGWEPAFLSLDGEEIIFEGYKAPSNLRDFRVAFYIQEWEGTGRLVSPAGELALPPFVPVPKRLWRLAPYSCVD